MGSQAAGMEIEQMSTTAALAPATNPIFHLSHTFKCTTKGTRKTPTIQNHTNKKSMDNKKSVLAHEEHLLQSLTMHPSTFDSPPLHCKLFPPVHHSTAGELVNNRMGETTSGQEVPQRYCRKQCGL